MDHSRGDKEADRFPLSREVLALQFLCAALVGVLTLALFLLGGQATAFEWPSADMFPFYERLRDSAFLPGDFWTNSVSSPNPRHVFVFLLRAFCETAGLDWYAGYFWLKTVLSAALPMAYFFFVSSAALRYAGDSIQIRGAVIFLAAAGTLLGTATTIPAGFGISGWRPYTLFAGSHSFSLLLGLFAGTLAFFSRRFAAAFFFFLSALVHPAVGLFSAGLYFLCGAGRLRAEWKPSAVYLASCFAAALSLKLWYRQADPMPAVDFIYHYIRQRHPWHYLTSQLYSELPVSGGVILALVTGLLLLPAFAFRKKTPPLLRRLALWFSAAYAGSVAAQFLFTEVVPLKAVAELGPLRFTMFSYWMLVILYSAALPSLAMRETPGPERRFFSRLFPVSAGLFAAVLLAASIFGVTAKDDPFSRLKNERAGFFDWAGETPEGSVFAVPYTSDLHLSLTMIGKRSLYSSKAFPFTESQFENYTLRRCRLYGCGKDESAGVTHEGLTEHYRALGPEDFAAIAREKDRLDYAVIEKAYAGRFTPYAPVFEEEDIVVYRIADFS